MSPSSRRRPALHLAALGLAAASLAAPASAELLFASTVQGGLISFDSATPGTLSSSVAVSGLGAGQSLIGIDFRPATGQLYGLTSGGLYSINTTTGAATAVGAPIAVATTTTTGVDFNPTVDRLRVTSDNDANLRLNPNDGTLAATDTPLAYQAGDPNAGTSPNVVASAYTNNFAGAATTALYDIDFGLDVLALQVNPNGGLLQTVGPLGIDATGLTAFDISGIGGVAYLSTQAGTAPFSNLYTVNLGTGAATLIGAIGGGVQVSGLAARVGTAVPEPGTWAMMLIGFGAAGAALRRRRRAPATA